jgi:hypothetical protein
VVANRRFPSPWSIEDNGAAAFIVNDGGGQKLAHVSYDDQVCSRRPFDPMVGSVNFDFMGPLHRAINMIVAVTLVDTTWPRWITIVAIIVGAAGLYWLWEEHVNLGQQSRDRCPSRPSYSPATRPGGSQPTLPSCRSCCERTSTRQARRPRAGRSFNSVSLT